MEEKFLDVISAFVWLALLAELIVSPLLYFTTRKKFDLLLISKGYELPLEMAL